jgi:general secretion pathway protein D
VPGKGGTGEGLELDGTNAFVIADVKNNQILVKAPQARQNDFRKLIEKIDLRRPQVYLEVRIVAVTWSDNLRLAFETQLINAQGTGGLLQTNFGLTSAGQNSSIIDRRNVATGLGGLTAAIVKSDQIPIVVTALQTKADTRILSSPSLLVDDNEEAEIMSVEQQPYSTTQVTTGAPNTTSFGGYESAGTKLNITPSISEDGYIKLAYETELSSFTGQGTNGSPPPKLENNVKAASLTVPSDSTVVVGGLNVDTRRTTRVQVPLLGDIPIIGQLFQDYNRTGQTTTLYVFITPRIMREPNFADLHLLSEGPQKRAKIESDLPALKPTAITIDGGPIATPAATESGS